MNHIYKIFVIFNVVFSTNNIDMFSLLNLNKDLIFNTSLNILYIFELLRKKIRDQNLNEFINLKMMKKLKYDVEI